MRTRICHHTFWGRTPLPNCTLFAFFPSLSYFGGIFSSNSRSTRRIVLAFQIEDKWKVLATSCHAPYTRRSAHITTNSTFNQMWANYTSIENVDERMETALRLSSLIGGNNQPPDEMIRAKKVALKGFQFNESTAAGVYRGRLANFYWYAVLKSATCVDFARETVHLCGARALVLQYLHLVYVHQKVTYCSCMHFPSLLCLN